MRMLVLGAGLQGSACAYDLLQNSEVERVTLGDVAVDVLPPFLDRYHDDPRLRLERVDARERASVRALMQGHDACMNALPYYFNLSVTEDAIASGLHYCDLGGNTEIVFQQLELDVQARERGVSAIPDCGLAPGMVNILAHMGIKELDSTDSVKIRVGGLPQQPEPPLNYQIVYSLHGVLDYYTTPAWVLRDGDPRQVDALSELEPVDFPWPIGTLEAFHTGGGLSTLPWKHKGRIREMEYKTLRYPGHAHIMRAIRDLGLLDLKTVSVGEFDVVPRELFITVVEPRLHKPVGRDLVAMRVEVEGTKDGAHRCIVYDCVDRYDAHTGVSAMERTTGFSLSITGQMQARGQVAGPGVNTPDESVPGDLYIGELEKRGIGIQKRVE